MTGNRCHLWLADCEGMGAEGQTWTNTVTWIIPNERGWKSYSPQNIRLAITTFTWDNKFRNSICVFILQISILLNNYLLWISEVIVQTYLSQILLAMIICVIHCPTKKLCFSASVTSFTVHRNPSNYIGFPFQSNSLRLGHYLPAERMEIYPCISNFTNQKHFSIWQHKMCVLPYTNCHVFAGAAIMKCWDCNLKHLLL